MAVEHEPTKVNDTKPMLARSWLAAAALQGFLCVAGAVVWRDGGRRTPREAPQALRLEALSAAEGLSPGVMINATGVAANPEPTRVNLKLDSVPAEQAFELLAKQAGAKVIRDGIEGWEAFDATVVSIHVQDAPFLAVLQELLQKSGVDVPPFYHGPHREGLSKTIVLSRSDKGRGKPVQLAGSFSIRPDLISRTVGTSLTGEGRDEEDAAALQMTVMGEPKLQLIFIHPLAVVEEAVDENERPLIGGRSSAQDGYNVDDSRVPWIATVSAKLTPVADAGRRVARIKGHVRAYARATDEQLYEIEDVLGKTNVAMHFNDVEVGLDFVRKEDRGWRVRYTVRLHPNDIRVRLGFGMYPRLVKLYDGSGKAFMQTGSSSTPYPDRYEFSVFFDPAGMGEPKKAALTILPGLCKIRVPFEFEDLPLP